MPIVQKRIFEVSLPNRLKNLLEITEHSVSTLKDLRLELVNFGNEIGETLGVFEAKPTMPIAKQKSVVAVGTAEQKNKIFAALKEKHRLTSRQIIGLTGIAAQTVYCIMYYLYNTKQVLRSKNTDTNRRGIEYVFELPPSSFDVLQTLETIE